MCQALRPIWLRWEISSPVIYAEEAHGKLAPVFDALRQMSILRPTTPAAAITCTECGERRRVRHYCDHADKLQGFIQCRDCGIVPVTSDLLLRWRIDTTAFLAALFRDIKLSIREQCAGHLWQVGKAKWAGRTREVWFAREFHGDGAPLAVDHMARRPKSILFVPTEDAVAEWQESTESLVLALESTVAFDNGSMVFDTAYVESRLEDNGLGETKDHVRSPRKRGERTAKIEALTKAVIDHLKAARDHAFTRKKQIGQAELLPRPSQKLLASLAGLTESDVSRCLGDASARELRLYWEVANDLGRIMEWEGRMSLWSEE